MLKTIQQPRENISELAPTISKMSIAPSKIGKVIGPGGKMIRSITEDTGCDVDIDDEGTVVISGPNGTSVKKALDFIEGLTAEAVIGTIYDGTVKGIKDFGAFVEILPGTEGLLHISEFSNEFVKDIFSVCNMGDKFKVKVLNVDNVGKIKLTRKGIES